jgi:hypothetical protein
MKPKYRIVMDEGHYPYKVQKKTFIFWTYVESSDSLDSATEKMIKLCDRENKIPKGTVLATYSTEDLLADKLRGR